MTIRNRWKDARFDRYVWASLAAIELLMSFTFLGYIHLPPISITIAYLPLLVAGCIYGPAQAASIGLVFGLASMFKASASYVLPADAVFSPLVSGAPVSSVLLAVGTRALYGAVIGAAYSLAKKSRRSRWWIGLLTVAAPKMHSLFVYTAMGILFPELGYNSLSAFRWKMNDAVFAAVCLATVEILWALYQSEAVQNVRLCIDQSIHNPYAPERMHVFFAAFEGFIVCMALLAAFYFSERLSYMLGQYGIEVSLTMSRDLLFLQLQFLFSFLALNVISIIALLSMYQYMSYKKFRGDLDELTGVMGRRMFLACCERVQKPEGSGRERNGWFLFVDADYFKQINDTFGHAVGDQVLRSIASNLQDAFGADGAVGRIGGDEFAVMVDKALPKAEIERRLDRFLGAVAQTLPEKTVSCSIGAFPFAAPQNVKQLMAEADEMLYQAKEKGRACYVVKEPASRT